MEEKIFKAEILNPMLLGEFMKNELHISAGFLRKLKNTPNGITRNGKLIRTVDTVFPNDQIVIKFEDENKIDGNPDLNAQILFEDEELIIFNKPSGMPVHPSHRHRFDTLGNYFSFLYPDRLFRPINRLDKDTSGACAVAKSQRSAAYYQNKIAKTYFAVCEGKISNNGTIDLPIKREQETIIKRCVSFDGQYSVTNYKVLKYSELGTLLEIYLETGRTHQIRVHFSHINHPLMGDDLYNGNLEYIDRQALHCGKLCFYNMINNEFTEIDAPFQDDMNKIINMI